jgi:acetylornithine/N-succinyldiaminopimelate aminotransferase
MVKPEFRPFNEIVTGADRFHVICKGRHLLDFSGSAMTTGYNFIKPEWLSPAVSRLVFTNNYTMELKKRLTEMTGFENVAFSTSGTEACDTALSRFGKPIIALEGAYHGLTFLTRLVSNGTGYDEENNIIHFKCPGPDISTAEAMTYNHEILKNTLVNINGGTMIIELIQSDGGVNVLPVGFVRELFALAKEFGLHTIVDEVYTGYGRSGEMFLHQKYQVHPDMVCIGKGMAAGLPLGAVLYNNTWDLPYNDVVSMSAGSMFVSRVAIEVIKQLDEMRLDYVRRNGKEIINKLLTIKNNRITSVRGRGYMIGIEFKDDNGNPDGKYALQIRNRLFNSGVVCSLTGYSNNVLKITPPVLIDQESLNNGINIIMDVLSK